MSKASGHFLVLAGAAILCAGLAMQWRLGTDGQAVRQPGEDSDLAPWAAHEWWRAESPSLAPSQPEAAEIATVVVTVPKRKETAAKASAAPAARSATPGDRSSVARELQRELRRVGCYDGELSGVWTQRTRMAMKAFTDRVNASLPVDKPDQILLALVQSHQGVACVPPPVLAKAPAKPEPPETDAAPRSVPVPAIVPPIAAIAPKILAPPPNTPPAAPQPHAARVDPTQAPPQVPPPVSPAASGERPPRTLRHAGPVPEVGVYERRPRRAARPYRQVRYARALLRSLKRAASSPWRLP